MTVGKGKVKIVPLAVATGIVALVAAGIAIWGLVGASSGDGEERPDTDTSAITTFASIADAVGVDPYDNVVDPAGTDAERLASKLEVDERTAQAVASLSARADATADEYRATLGNDMLYEIIEPSTEGEGVSIGLPFASRRLVLPCPEDAELPETNPVAETYDSFTESRVMVYRTMADTLEAYRALVGAFGKGSVMVDMKMKAEEATPSYDGWGVADMRLDQAEDALDSHEATARVKVAVIDSGIRRSHEVFDGTTIEPASGTMISIRQSALSSTDYDDDNGHGTYVAGILATGTPSEVSLLVIKCLDSTGSGSLYDIYYAMKYATDKEAKVANLSLATELGTTAVARDNMANFDRRMRLFTENDGIIVVAASNEGRNIALRNTYPAISRYTQAVGALDQGGKRAYYSNYGTALDFVAPGTNIVVASPHGDAATERQSGTSLAAPHVTALMANLRCVYPDKTADEIIAIARACAVDLGSPGKDAYYGYGKPVADVDALVAELDRRQAAEPDAPQPLQDLVMMVMGNPDDEQAAEDLPGTPQDMSHAPQVPQVPQDQQQQSQQGQPIPQPSQPDSQQQQPQQPQQPQDQQQQGQQQPSQSHQQGNQQQPSQNHQQQQQQQQQQNNQQQQQQQNSQQNQQQNNQQNQQQQQNNQQGQQQQEQPDPTPPPTPQHTIRFLNWDGGLLASEQYPHGTPASSIACPTPSRAADANYTYSFAGWTPSLADVSGDATYTAVFNAIPKPKPTLIDMSQSGNPGNVNLDFEDGEYDPFETYTLPTGQKKTFRIRGVRYLIAGSPVINLQQGVDYEVAYVDNTATQGYHTAYLVIRGKADGQGQYDYTGEYRVPFMLGGM